MSLRLSSPVQPFLLPLLKLPILQIFLPLPVYLRVLSTLILAFASVLLTQVLSFLLLLFLLQFFVLPITFVPLIFALSIAPLPSFLHVTPILLGIFYPPPIFFLFQLTLKQTFFIYFLILDFFFLNYPTVLSRVDHSLNYKPLHLQDHYVSSELMQLLAVLLSSIN